ncbi:rod shape-determining protein MreD [Vagococcus elongatus]|uniref:Rod shape-determining protein MreD n=1 Tax=Vagococcus elongatus TaxID=180344 RepID=A0A430B123_9ENTE|nr:rod shape-determining protein MreD [Vagococcus elongatus]RSU14043.1 rod shape-determining protein MreD [Vagococcus elongatus]
MQKKREVMKVLLPLLVLLAMLMDSQISNILRLLTGGELFFISHFMLLGLIMGSLFYSKTYMVITSIILGLLFDTYYYSILGINTVSLPLTVLLVYLVFDYIEPTIPTLLLSLVIFITIMDGSAYFIQVIFNLIEGNLLGFVSTQLGPTLLMNMTIFILLAYPIKKISEKSNRG